MIERIKLAAIRSGNHIICGKTHAECLRIAEKAGFPKPNHKFGQGFLTTKWRFVLRKEALQIAEKQGQIDVKHSPTNVLLSEDLNLE